jgi:hypothetical protein
MPEPAAIAATFSDLKLIRGRKVCQLVFEIPVEQASQATAALGFPHAETWCAIARLDTKKTSGPLPHSRGPDGAGDRAQSGTPVPPVAAPAQPNPNIRKFMALARDTSFWDYVRRAKGAIVKDEREAVAILKTMCGIESREGLTEGGIGVTALTTIARSFNDWQRGRQ